MSMKRAYSETRLQSIGGFGTQSIQHICPNDLAKIGRLTTSGIRSLDALQVCMILVLPHILDDVACVCVHRHLRHGFSIELCCCQTVSNQVRMSGMVGREAMVIISVKEPNLTPFQHVPVGADIGASDEMFRFA